MSSWQPLRHRQSGTTESLYEGVPAHLAPPLWHWVRSHIVGDRGVYFADTMRQIAMLARMPITTSDNRVTTLHSFEDNCTNDPENFLSVVDATLKAVIDPKRNPRTLEKLQEILDLSNSAWTISPDRSGLTRRVDPSAEAAATQAMSIEDAASNELREAWSKAYGRDTDASDAWDHSIKAVEHIYRSVISPNNDRATLGTLIRDLRDGSHLFSLTLDKPGASSVESLLGMLKLLWPNPDRHGDGEGVDVSIDAARAAVHLAITLVQWGRSGALTKQP